MLPKFNSRRQAWSVHFRIRNRELVELEDQQTSLKLVEVLLLEEILHQLRLVVYPIIHRGLYIPGGCLGFLLPTVCAYFDTCQYMADVITTESMLLLLPSDLIQCEMDFDSPAHVSDDNCNTLLIMSNLILHVFFETGTKIAPLLLTGGGFLLTSKKIHTPGTTTEAGWEGLGVGSLKDPIRWREIQRCYCHLDGRWISRAYSPEN